ncbi:MAG: exo-alpha-sialidase [Pirellulales bacterium]|nr:exo-alpha-sialidase [Pirellulales bacterium]
MCEPTTYRRGDGVLVRLYRDEGPSDFLYSHCLYASLSRDNGKLWTKPAQTNIPDSPSRSSAGNLPDGRCFIVGNQVAEPFSKRIHKHYTRDPLVISVSRDGKSFDFSAAIRAGAPNIRARGSGKGRGYQYPATEIVGDDLWVLYSVGKEDIAISRVPLKNLKTRR